MLKKKMGWRRPLSLPEDGTPCTAPNRTLGPPLPLPVTAIDKRFAPPPESCDTHAKPPERSFWLLDATLTGKGKLDRPLRKIHPRLYIHVYASHVCTYGLLQVQGAGVDEIHDV